MNYWTELDEPAPHVYSYREGGHQGQHKHRLSLRASRPTLAYSASAFRPFLTLDVDSGRSMITSPTRLSFTFEWMRFVRSRRSRSSLMICGAQSLSCECPGPCSWVNALGSRVDSAARTCWIVARVWSIAVHSKRMPEEIVAEGLAGGEKSRA